MEITQIVTDILIVLAAGLIAGTVCRRLQASLLIGYLVVGALIGKGGLHLAFRHHDQVEHLAEVGALLLLFSVGIEFSLDELYRLSRFFFVGGMLQMSLVAVPLIGVTLAFQMPWNVAVLLGFACALSSTVLVFRALTELGQADSPHGKRAVGILLFQDVALVPLLLVIPMITGKGDPPTISAFALLGATSTVFVAGVLVVRHVVRRWIVPLLANLRSVELVVLFTVCALGVICCAAHELGLPAAVGALAAGLTLSGNRLSKQIDTILLPFRETFAAIFFVTLGMLLEPLEFFRQPVLLTSLLLGVVAIKTGAALIALKAIGLSWRASAGMGLGLAQLGEFSFLLVAEGVSEGIISTENYGRVLFVALGTLILTPWFLKLGLKLTADSASTESVRHRIAPRDTSVVHGLVIGVGPIGRQLASRMETMGIDVCLVDLSPINLYAFAQLGYRTISGDARDPDVLERCGIKSTQCAVVSVPDDQIAIDIVKSLRAANSECSILVRCRFETNVVPLANAGAVEVVSEEAEAAGRLLHYWEKLHAARVSG